MRNKNGGSGLMFCSDWIAKRVLTCKTAYALSSIACSSIFSQLSETCVWIPRHRVGPGLIYHERRDRASIS